MLSAQLFAQLHEPNIIRCLPTDSLLSEAATSLIHFPLYVHFVRGQVVSEAARVSVTLATLYKPPTFTIFHRIPFGILECSVKMQCHRGSKPENVSRHSIVMSLFHRDTSGPPNPLVLPTGIFKSNVLNVQLIKRVYFHPSP